MHLQSRRALATGGLHGDGTAKGDCPDCRAEPVVRAKRSEEGAKGAALPVAARLQPLVCAATGYPPRHAFTEDAKRHSTTAFLHRRIVNRFPITSDFPVKTLRLRSASHRQPGFDSRRPALG
jgi:hypothetical protein